MSITINSPQTPLVSNGFTLDTSSQRLGYLQPTEPGLPVNQLREQYEAQGYLWLKGFLDRQEVLAFRGRYFEAFRETGLLAAGSDPREGIYAGNGEDEVAAHKILAQAVKWAAFEAFCLDAPIIRFYEAFLGDTVYLHKRKLMRYNKPGGSFATPAHYDLTYLRGGTDQLCTSWIPIGDVDIAMGGLIYLKDSVKIARQLEAEYMQRSADLAPQEQLSAYNKYMREGGWIGPNLPALAERYDTQWLVANYEAGDMMVHSPYMIHAATENQDAQGRIRLSTDIRYQRVRDAIDSRWTQHWSPDDGL